MAASRSPRLALSRAANNVGDRDQEETTLAQHRLADLHHQLQPAVTVGRGVPIQQRDTQRVLGEAQCEYRCWIPRRSAPPPRSRAPRSHRPEAPRTVSRNCRSRRRHWRGLSGRCFGPSRRRRGGLGAIRDGPATTEQAPRNANATASGDPIPKPAPLAGSPSARSMTVCDHRKSLAEFTGIEPVAERYERQPDRQGGIADRLEQRHLFGCQPRRLTRAPGVEQLGCQPGHADGQRDLVPGGAAQLPQLREAAPRFPGLLGLDPRWHTAWCGGRCASTIGRGRRRVGVGDPAGALPTEPGSGDIAVG